jgi:hypothetical protein
MKSQALIFKPILSLCLVVSAEWGKGFCKAPFDLVLAQSR